MKIDYRTRLEGILSRLRPRLRLTHHLEFKPCFGAVAGYVDGRIFVSCGKFGVALKLPAQDLAELFKEKGVRQLRYFPNGHIKTEYAIVPERIVEDGRRFSELLDRSLKYAVRASGNSRSSVPSRR